MSTMQPDREYRYAAIPLTGIEVRDPTATHDNTWTMSGYAAVFDDTTVLYDSKFVRLTEAISPQAFDGVLASQTDAVHLNFGHDMNRAVASTGVPAGQEGSLQLRSDSRGLYFEAKVARDDPDAIALASKMRTGVVNQASFAFTIAPDGATYSTPERDSEDGPELEHRYITEIGHLYDVCACAQGAYSSTVSQLRSIAAQIGQPEVAVIGEKGPEVVIPLKDLPGGQRDQPDTGGPSDVSPDEGSAAATPPPLDWQDEMRREAVNRHRPVRAMDRT